MKKRICILFCAGLLAGMLSGCGGEYSGRQGEGALSGGMVSGDAVSGQAASGGAASGQAAPGTYTYCNDRCVYYTGVDELIGRDIETGKEAVARIDDIEYVCYADNEWVYYTKIPKQDEVWEEVWRMPVKMGEEWGLDEQAAELLLREEEGFDEPEGALCDGRFIVYITGDAYEYRQYNLEKKAYESCEALEERNDYAGGLYLCGGSAFIMSAEEGLLRKRLDRDEVETVGTGGNGCFSPDSVMVSETAGALFLQSGTPDEGEEEIWQYTLATGEMKKFMDHSEIQALLKEKNMLSCPCPASGKHKHEAAENGMFVSGNRLYVQIYIYNRGGPECHNLAVLSKEIGSPGKLCYEEELSDCLKNPEKNPKTMTKHMPGSGVPVYEKKVVFQSRGLLVMMIENKCLMYVEDPEAKENRWACHDLETGEFQYITEKDPEWYMRYFDDHHHILEGRMKDDPVDLYANDYRLVLYMMPNNYDF